MIVRLLYTPPIKKKREQPPVIPSQMDESMKTFLFCCIAAFLFTGSVHV